MAIYAGLDVNPSEAHTKNSTFCVTILFEDNTKKVFHDVKATSLAYLIKQNQVEVVAFDNLAELVPVLTKLMFELSTLERNIEFVEVAYDQPLEVKSQKLGLFGGGKLSPQLASEVVAKIAKMGYGKKIDLFAPKTVIKIVRRRVPGSGGSSSLRFKRNVETQIKYLKGKIEAKLKSSNLDYDVYARESTGGYSSVTFVVYSDPSSLRSVVYPYVGRDYAVRVERFSARFRYKEPKFELRPIVVGYDPGITTGISVLDLSGRVLGFMSARNFDRSEVISYCAKYGSPVVVATDVSTPPDAVKKLCAAFGAKLFTPAEDLSVEEKRELVRRFGVQFKTTHERDALAAAIKAYIFYSKLFEAIKQKAASEGVSTHILELVRVVLDGKNVDSAIAELRAKYEIREAPKPRAPPLQNAAQSDVEQLEKEISLLRARLIDAESRALKAEERSKELEAKLKSVLNEKEISIRRDRELANLEFRVSELAKALEESQVKLKTLEAINVNLVEAIRKVAEGRVLLIRILDDLSKSSVERCLSDQASKVEMVYVRNPNHWDLEGLALLKKRGVIGIVVAGQRPVSLPVFYDYELPLLGAAEVGFQEVPSSDAGLVGLEALKVARERLKEVEQKNREKKLESLKRLLEGL